MDSRGSTQQLLVDLEQQAPNRGLYTRLRKGLHLSGWLSVNPTLTVQYSHCAVDLNPAACRAWYHLKFSVSVKRTDTEKFKYFVFSTGT